MDGCGSSVSGYDLQNDSSNVGTIDNVGYNILSSGMNQFANNPLGSSTQSTMGGIIGGFASGGGGSTGGQNPGPSDTTSGIGGQGANVSTNCMSLGEVAAKFGTSGLGIGATILGGAGDGSGTGPVQPGGGGPPPFSPGSQSLTDLSFTTPCQS